MDPADAASMLATALERAQNAHVRRELVLSLASVAGRRDAVEAGRIRRQAARVMIAALGREKDANACAMLAEDVVSVVSGMDKTEAAKIIGQAAQLLAGAFARETDANARNSLASALAKVSARLEPAEAARTCGRAARVLADALDREKNAGARSSLASGLVSLAGLMDQFEFFSPLVTALIRETNDNRLASNLASLASRSNPTEAARVYGQAAHVLTTALEHEKGVNERSTLASNLASLAGRLDPAEAARINGQAARSLAVALARDTNDQSRVMAASSLSSIVARMAPVEAARVLAASLKQGANPTCLTELARILSTTVNRLDDAEANRVCDQLIRSLDRESFYSIAPELLDQLNPARAHALAWDLASRMCSEPEFRTDTLSRILTETSREQRARRAAKWRRAGPGPEGALEAAVRIAAEPFPCRLTTQELVELLKMPTCFGAERRVVLDHLGNRYSRRFVNHWAFVRFAKEQKLDLDFTTPPKRPDPKETIVRMLKILDRP
jgi:hypothetical protein